MDRAKHNAPDYRHRGIKRVQRYEMSSIAINSPNSHEITVLLAKPFNNLCHDTSLCPDNEDLAIYFRAIILSLSKYSDTLIIQKGSQISYLIQQEKYGICFSKTFFSKTDGGITKITDPNSTTPSV